MKKIIWVPILIMIFLVSFLLIDIFPARHEESKSNVKADSYLDQATGPIEELELLEVLKADRTATGEEALKVLAERVDATGYISNLILAERFEEKDEDSVGFYQKALELYDTREIQLKLADALGARGDIEEAILIYMTLIQDDRAIKAMMELGVEYSVIVNKLLEGNHNVIALQFIKKNIPNVDNDEAEILNKQYALLLARTEAYTKAIPLMEDIIELGETDDDFMWWYGRSLEGLGEKDKAIEVYKGLDKIGAYRLGLLLEEKGILEEAAIAYINSTAHISRWKGARILDDFQREEEALKVYYELAKETGSYQEDAAYRAYVLQTKLNIPVEDEVIEVLEKSPAWMMALGREYQWQLEEDMTPKLPEFLNRVKIFESNQKYEIAEIEKAIGEKYTSTAEKLGLGEWYQQQGQFYMAVRWGSRALNEVPSRKAYELTYQRPFQKEVLSAAEEFNIDPYLIWAVMREESHYRTDALSRVGAMGLMQIMPATGQDIANRLKVSYSDKDMLKAEKNIRFGAFYISLMLNMFEGDLDKALAAYNGGQGNVRRWSRTTVGETPEGFPTSITFMETRRYITKVKNSYYTYLWLYDEE
ncbi:lytic transglycosylase domain-containing protein [Alkaliphilus peptidifermentans]|uniref:Soluble lytic murein transglycosylase n=1 Tax=Alkaliphilus peptidifermentans DSM 18978 TaxID=1120976 RepID=A0A1G5FIE0_9FIRM|nr:lytic transglycosylase domain-containing protein [Alkaliphilus peptidifermentans]SCY38620.1 soluble lytic murein transglycosylase [Alkaliphilus peptidifermentans DSM 18978]